MINIVITSFKEPKTIARAIDSFLIQKIEEDYRLTVCAPDEETLNIARKYAKRNSKINIFKDPGKGKSFALNMLLPSLNGRIIVLSDGDVYVEKNSLQKIINAFLDPSIGCATGRPVSSDSRKNILGYWSHLLCDAGAHEARLRRWKQKQFLECSGYYWAFRNNIVNSFPIDVAEDTIVPYLFRDKGYRIAYVPEAKVYVGFPKTLNDFIKQKVRTGKSHESLEKYYPIHTLPRTKSFKNEIFEGYRALTYPKNITEFVYSLLLLPVRLYIWLIIFYDTKITKRAYGDNWERVETTK